MEASDRSENPTEIPCITNQCTGCRECQSITALEAGEQIREQQQQQEAARHLLADLEAQIEDAARWIEHFRTLREAECRHLWKLDEEGLLCIRCNSKLELTTP